VKANKKTLMAVKQFLQNGEGWDLDELISEWTFETKLLKHKDMGDVDADECSIKWDEDEICGLDEFIDKYTEILIEKFCNVLDSFVNEDLTYYEFE
jgi:hypothetical protein